MRRTTWAPASRRERLAESRTTGERGAANALRSARARLPGTSFTRRSPKDRPYGGDQGHEDPRDDRVLHRVQWRLHLGRRRGARGHAERALERREEVVGELEGGRVDEAVTDLRDAPANLRRRGVGEQRAAVLVGERHLRAPLGESRGAAFTVEAQGVALEGDHVLEAQLAAELRAHRAQRCGDTGGILVVPGLLDRLATRDRRLQDRRVVERRPRARAINGELALAAEFHKPGTDHGFPPGGKPWSVPGLLPGGVRGREGRRCRASAGTRPRAASCWRCWQRAARIPRTAAADAAARFRCLIGSRLA